MVTLNIGTKYRSPNSSALKQRLLVDGRFNCVFDPNKLCVAFCRWMFHMCVRLPCTLCSSRHLHTYPHAHSAAIHVAPVPAYVWVWYLIRRRDNVYKNIQAAYSLVFGKHRKRADGVAFVFFLHSTLRLRVFASIASRNNCVCDECDFCTIRIKSRASIVHNL